MCRGENNDPGFGCGERRDVEALRIDWDGNDLEPAASGDGAVGEIAGVLDRDLAHALAGERAQDQVQRLREAGADDDVVGIGDRGADAAEVGGEHVAQFGVAPWIAVPERGHRGPLAALAHRPGPIVPREARQIGQAGHEIDGQSLRRHERCARRWQRLGGRGDTGGGAAPAGQIALRLELSVAVEYQPARHAKLVRERSRRGKPLACAEAAATDRVAQLLF